MKKLTLKLDDLVVESFHTGISAESQIGTVQGYMDTLLCHVERQIIQPEKGTPTDCIGGHVYCPVDPLAACGVPTNPIACTKAIICDYDFQQQLVKFDVKE